MNPQRLPGTLTNKEAFQDLCMAVPTSLLLAWTAEFTTTIADKYDAEGAVSARPSEVYRRTAVALGIRTSEHPRLGLSPTRIFLSEGCNA